MRYNIQKREQQGIALSSMLFWSIVLVMVAVFGMKVVPVYIENATIKKNLIAITNDPSLQNSSASQIRLAFSKRAQIDGITEVSSKDIKITREKGKLNLSVDYSVIVPLVANVSLKIDFDTQAD